MTLTPVWLDELRARTALSTLIGKSIKVTRAGREWKACCPFHNEKTPSFTINDEKGFYHCFGCGAHGDAIRWMTEQRGLPFMDAVKELAAAAGMDVPAPDPRAAARQEEQKSLRDVTEAAATWYRDRLASDEGVGARAYLQRRGLSPALCQSFGIGYAPDARGRMRDLLSPFGDAMAVEAGMLIQPPDDAPADRREPYDRFRGRLMIPISDVRGRVIAFGGRTLGDAEPKYLNSPDTPLFDKGRVLFNLDRAAAAARRAERLILVEGYMDVIALAQAGIGEAVAPLGTALTEAQIELAWRQVTVPLLAFDGDAAGQRAAIRAALRALRLLRPGFSLAFVTLPKGKDPDDIVREGGAPAFNQLCETATPLVDMLWQAALAQQRSETPEARAAVRATLMGWVEDIADRDVAAHYRQAFRERLDARFFARSAPPTQGRTPWRNSRPERAPSGALRNVGGAIGASLSDAIIGGLLRYPAIIVDHADTLHHLPVNDPASAALLSVMIDVALTHQGLDSDGMLTILGPLPEYNRATQLLRADGTQFSFSRPQATGGCGDGRIDIAGSQEVALRDLEEAIGAAVAWPEIERALAVATEAMRTRMDNESFAEQQRLLKAKADMTSRLMRMTEAATDI